jgi:TonB family protein
MMAAACLAAATSLLAQQPASQATRKVVNRVAPEYPSLAKQIHVQGSVKLLAVVEPDGHVKAVDVKGGNPVLAQAAVSAVKKWKYEPAGHETDEAVEMQFDPQ